MSGNGRFRSLVVCLSTDPEGYEDIMQDVMVNKTGRYVIVSGPKHYWDQKTASAHVSLDIIDHGEQS